MNKKTLPDPPRRVFGGYSAALEFGSSAFSDLSGSD
jgi:hypothetical protein